MVESIKSYRMFVLDAKLQQDSLFVKDLPFSQLRLMNDRRYLWLVLIPRCDDVTELLHLSPDQQQVLLQEVQIVSKVLHDWKRPDKLNIASLGNVVAQLHVHIIARYKNDASWPKPVWGNGDCIPYGTCDGHDIITQLVIMLE